MSIEQCNEVSKQYRTALDKYVYFLLAASSAAMYLVVNQTHDAKLVFSQIPLGFAIILWGCSFFFGCKHISNMVTALYCSTQLIAIESGLDPVVGKDPVCINCASTDMSENVNSKLRAATNYSEKQFDFLILGAVFYLFWHVLEMILRTIQ